MPVKFSKGNGAALKVNKQDRRKGRKYHCETSFSAAGEGENISVSVKVLPPAAMVWTVRPDTAAGAAKSATTVWPAVHKFKAVCPGADVWC